MTGYSRGQEGVYVAEAGEDLLRIAGARGVPVGLLEELNPGVGRRDSLQTGQAVAVPSPHRHRGTVVAVSNRQAGPCLVAIDVCSGEVRVLEAGACAWSSVPVLSPDGDRVAYQGPDGRVAVLSTDGGSPVPIGRSPSGFVSPKWSPTGELLAWDSDGVTEVLSASGELVARIEGACPSWMGRGRSIAVIRDGRAVLVDLGDGTSVQLEAVLRPQDQVWAVHGATMGSVYACVATVNGQLRLEVHDWFTGDRAGVDVGSDLWPWSIKWSPDCTMLAAPVRDTDGHGERCDGHLLPGGCGRPGDTSCGLSNAGERPALRRAQLEPLIRRCGLVCQGGGRRSVRRAHRGAPGRRSQDNRQGRLRSSGLGSV